MSIKKEHARAVMFDIAQHSGVSVATVSRVLNGRPDVAVATRERVMKSVQALGYMSNRYSDVLETRRPSYIGAIVPKIDHVMQLLTGISEGLKARHAHLLVYPTDYEQEQEVSILEQFAQGAADGAIIILPAESSAELAQWSMRNYPFVVIDPRLPLAEHIPVVATANMSGARAATEHLLALGHRRIGVITGYPNWCASVDRLAGYHAVLVAAGIVPAPELTAISDFTLEGGMQATEKLLALPDPPTAIFALNDDMAIGALRVAQERGLKVPEELSIVGFGDSLYASMVVPPLTTVRQTTEEIGRMAVEVLYRLIDGQPLQANRIELSMQLVVRATTTTAQKRF